MPPPRVAECDGDAAGATPGPTAAAGGSADTAASPRDQTLQVAPAAAGATAATACVATATAAAVPPRSWADLAQHASADDAWIAIRGRVYDVTAFADEHPGGDIILTAAGRDATDVFAGFHASTDAWKGLAPLCVGTIDESLAPSNLLKVDHAYIRDVLNMRAQVEALNLYQSSKLYYAYKLASNIAILVASIALLCYAPDSWPAIVVAACLLALFWQQCGWLAHDFLHHQVFFDRRLNNAVGVLVGNVFQGFSVSWWKNKHNHHHAVPNVTDSPSGGDPDIQTMPVLFWSEKLIEGEDLEKLPRFLLRNQATFYWPILCMARLSWVLQSAQYQMLPRNRKVTSDAMYAAEVAGLVVHHLSFIAIISLFSSAAKVLVFSMLSQGLGGLFIGIVFTVGHNAMEVLTPEEHNATHFVSLQARTTRNVTPSLFNDWFTGGLNYQIEHHIWPSIPRHALPKAAVIFKAFCAKHNVPYTCKGLVEGNAEVCRLLAAIGVNAS